MLWEPAGKLRSLAHVEELSCFGEGWFSEEFHELSLKSGLAVCLAIGQMCNLRVLQLRFVYSQECMGEYSMWRFLAKGLRSCRSLTSVKLLQGGGVWQDICFPALRDRDICEFTSEETRLDETVVRMIASWKRLRRLDLGKVSPSTGCGLLRVLASGGVGGRLEGLAVGQYSWRDDMTIWSEVIGVLPECHRLRRVVLRYTEFITVGVPFLRLPSSVRELVLQGCGYMGQSAHRAFDGANWIGCLIADMPQLEVLDIGMSMSPVLFRMVAARIPTNALHTLCLPVMLRASMVYDVCALLARSPCIVSLRFRSHERDVVCCPLVLALSRMRNLRDVRLGSIMYLDHYVPLMLGGGFVLSCSDPVVFRRRL